MHAPSLVCAVALIACASGARAEGGIFQGAVQPIFDANCVACHQAGAAAQGLNLESGSSYAALVNRRSSEAALLLVAPKSPETSYLLLKLLGTHTTAGGKGDRMPLGGSLATGDIQIVRNWIAAGAKDE
jgi:mono/diheme cytochrome c family protein